MSRLISVPREALAELLQAAGSPLTPEQYLASLPEFGEYRRYPGRAKAAVWSKNILLSGAILSVLWTCTPWGFGFESVLVTAIIVAITYFEIRTYLGFRDRKLEAPLIGFRNQCAFAAFFLVYGLYHAFVPMELPAAYRELIDPDQLQLIQSMAKVGYLIIGIVGCISQYGYAWYYWLARTRA